MYSGCVRVVPPQAAHYGMILSPLFYSDRLSGKRSYVKREGKASCLTKEEAEAIAAYLEYTRDADSHGLNAEEINAALNSFWRDRAATGPTHQAVRRIPRKPLTI